jgi:hypothetical protein
MIERALGPLDSDQLAALRALVAQLGVGPARRRTGLAHNTFDRARKGRRLKVASRRAIQEALARSTPERPP